MDCSPQRTQYSRNSVIVYPKVVDYEKNFFHQADNKLRNTLVRKHGPTKAAFISKTIEHEDSSAMINNLHSFSNVVTSVFGATHQGMSGRCWLYAALNQLKYCSTVPNIPEDMQLSASHLFKYDKIERVNSFLENIIDTIDQDLDSRIVHHLLRSPIEDGGQWSMFVNLVEKYGLVPDTDSPETWSCRNSRQLGRILNDLVRTHALKLRQEYEVHQDKDLLYVSKSKMVEEAMNVIFSNMSPPPTSVEYRGGASTPIVATDAKDFYSKFTPTSPRLTEIISLVDDPRHDVNDILVVDKLVNVVEGYPVKYVNVAIDTIKDMTKKCIDANIPVWFGADVGKYMDRESGILDPDAFDYTLVVGTDPYDKLTKKEALLCGQSQMNHAMLFTGYDKSSKMWKVENSWGKDVGKDGVFVMSDKWFDRFVFQVSIPEWVIKAENPSIINALSTTEEKILPIWDPMGALA